MVKKIWDEDIIFLRKLGFSGEKIARMHHMTSGVLYQRYGKLADEGYFTRMKPFASGRLRARLAAGKRGKKQHNQCVRRVVKVLQEHDGALPAGILKEKAGTSQLTDLATEEVLFRIKFALKPRGGYGTTFKVQEIFNEDYASQVYYCLNSRTVIVRTMMKAIKFSKENQHAITTFLNEYLSDAERIAVLWSHGVTKWSPGQVPSSVQVDGVIKPRGVS